MPFKYIKHSAVWRSKSSDEGGLDKVRPHRGDAPAEKSDQKPPKTNEGTRGFSDIPPWERAARREKRLEERLKSEQKQSDSGTLADRFVPPAKSDDKGPTASKPTGSIYADAVRKGLVKTNGDASAHKRTDAAEKAPRVTHRASSDAILDDVLAQSAKRRAIDAETARQAAEVPPQPDDQPLYADYQPQTPADDAPQTEDKPAPAIVSERAADELPERAFEKGTNRRPKKEKRIPAIPPEEEIWLAPIEGSSNAIIRFFGDLFNNLGFFAESKAVMVWRWIKGIAFLVFGMVAVLFSFLTTLVEGFISDILKQLRTPVKKTRSRFETMRSGGFESARAARQEQGALGRFGWLLGIVLPAAALFVFVFTVTSVLGTEYGLAVELDGEPIAHISDESVLEDAKSIIRGRLQLGGGQTLEDWQFSPVLKVDNAKNFTSKQQLANDILKESAMDIIDATGLYVDGELISVTTEGEELRIFLNDILAQHEQEGARVSFVRDIQCDPEADDVFLTDSVEDYDTLINRLSAVETEERRHIASGDESLADIAHENNILIDTLLSRNAEILEDDAPAAIPASGVSLLIAPEVPYLQVQTAVQKQETEIIPFASVERETNEKAKGVRRTLQRGIDGMQEVWVDYIYIEGELVNRVVLDEKTRVLNHPQEQITEVGTYDFSDSITGGYNPAYMWPVPAATYSSRGMGGGHRGRDINAPTGTPIFACNAGIVRTAGYHWSYGYYVEIEHPDGLLTLYGHCSYLNVSSGQVVQQGQYIAAVGSTGVSTGPHVHLEFQNARTGQLLNPDSYVSAPWR